MAMVVAVERLMGQARRLLPDMSGMRLRTAGGIGGALVVAALLYYPLGMLITSHIDDDTAFEAPAELTAGGGSRAVAMAIALINREVNENRWVANDPFLLPPAALDNMPNYQQGIISALARFAFELTDQIGRTRGTSQTDKDLQEAAGQLQYAGNIWVFDLSTSLAPTTTSEARYRKAARSLANYNQRLANGNAVFERRADNLMATLDRFALDMGASSATLDRQITEHSGDLFDTTADDVFYGIKGQSYAYYLIIRELGLDYAKVLNERELTNAWAKMLESLRHAAELSPLIVTNGGPDAQAVPSHLAAQGFYLLRARTKIREITNILLK